MVLEDLEAGLGHVDVELVAHAAGEEADLDAAADAGLVEVAHGGVERLYGHATDVAVADNALEQGRVGGLLLVLGAPEEHSGGRGAHAHAEVEELRLSEEDAEDHLLHDGEAEVGVDYLARLHEDFHVLHARGAAGLAGAAQKAATQLFGDGLGIAEDFVGQILDEDDLAAGDVAFHVRRAEHGADGLAVAALHAGGKPVVKLHEPGS